MPYFISASLFSLVLFGLMFVINPFQVIETWSLSLLNEPFQDDFDDILPWQKVLYFQIVCWSTTAVIYSLYVGCSFYSLQIYCIFKINLHFHARC